MRLRNLTMVVFALALGAVMSSGPASAVEGRLFAVENTKDLLFLCDLPRDDPQRSEAINYCMAYLDGVVDYHDVLTDHENMNRLICYPDTATLEQGVLVFIDWAEQGQSDERLMAEPPILGVVRALAAKWPCGE